jgi:hypothetical protein
VWHTRILQLLDLLKCHFCQGARKSTTICLYIESCDFTIFQDCRKALHAFVSKFALSVKSDVPRLRSSTRSQTTRWRTEAARWHNDMVIIRSRASGSAVEDS